MLLSDIDLSSHDTWRAGVPHEQLATLRREAPVYRHPGLEDDTPEFFWAVTRHGDVRACNRDWETFSSQREGTQLVGPRSAEEREGYRTMIDTDPPAHTRLRRLVNRGFTPRHVARFEAHYRDVTRRIVEEGVAKRRFDFVTEIAAELPLVAIAELLGVPVEDRHRLFDWTNRMVGSHDAEYAVSAEDATVAAMELYLYAEELAAARRVEPRDDIVTALVGAEDDDVLSSDEFDRFVLLLSVAGNETTRNAISHGLLALMEHPDQMDALRAGGHEVIASAAEEILRWATPVIQFRRTATRDVELAGQAIAEGDPVVLYYISANRDEEVFADPFRFDVRRSPNDHVAFGGGGLHFCLGANLARLELRIMLEELLARTRSIELDGPVQRLRSNFINGIKHLPVSVDPR